MNRKDLTHAQVNFYGERKTLEELSNEYEINLKTLISRYRKGVKNEKILLNPKKPEVLVNGKVMNIDEISKEAGKSRSTIYYRIKKGYKEDVLVSPKINSD
ncbi:hypothetical protein [Staphylococcus simiae]|uniref:Uncharacterized protein n=1 Tax=Staphylococcus simiae CCM 7213 = CCUG 51256 TaxID=911238 RepID=G5JH62_9STAP|nr:hypothetical protein [Staphylococcus simiae]EHJ08410.1 hypothetical protein SS7213T_03955 [Staphylococcus simiae CCM 7213 = CCUG 51256]PNZ12630.1 hypothetical protein CD113_06340 [Staphylococcus simiae]